MLKTIEGIYQIATFSVIRRFLIAETIAFSAFPFFLIPSSFACNRLTSLPASPGQLSNLQVLNFKGNPLTISSELHSQNRPDQNPQYWQNQLERARASGERELEGVAITNLGAIYTSLGEYNRGLELYQQGMLIFQELGDRSKEIWVLNNIGTAYKQLEQYDRAVEAYLRAIAIARSQGTLVREGWVWRNLGHTYRSMKQYDKAIQAFGQAVRVFQNTNAQDELADVTRLLQEVQRERDRNSI